MPVLHLAAIVNMDLPNYVYSNSLTIEETQTAYTKCEACSAFIAKNQLRATFRRTSKGTRYFHLQCYTPGLSVRIHPTDLTLKIQSEDCQLEVVQWVDRWNQQFEDRHEKYQLPRVKSEAGPQRRLLLEVFGYLTAVEIVKSAGEVCKSWYAVAWEDEVWKSHLPHPPAASLRAHYIVLYHRTCIRCGQFLQSAQVHMLCPLSHRPTCYTCYSLEENRPQHLLSLKGLYGLEPAVFKQLPTVRVFPFEGFDCVYYNEANAVIRKQRKELATAILARETPELVTLFGGESFRVLQGATEADFGIADMPHLLNRFSTYQDRNRLFEFIGALKPIKQFSRFVATVRKQ